MTKKHHGSCLCGAVTFEATVDPSKATQCNCTICTKTGVTGTSIKPDAFTLLTGKDNLGMWSRHPQIAQRWFCKTCGQHVYGSGDIPELGGAFVSIYVNVLDDVDLAHVEITHWDGRHDNWQAGTRPTRWPLRSGGDASPGGASA